MLLYLHVKNIAIIEEEEIEFFPGLNILSGETGAGKSIILGALSLAMGDKQKGSVIRDESKDALVEAVFSVSESQKAGLLDMDVECPEGEIILQRKITPTRSQAKINGENVPAAKLSQAAALLIDIYGQHDGQSLLSPKNHLKLLDEYDGDNTAPVLKELREEYRRYSAMNREYQSASMDENARLRQIDLLEHEIAQIEGASLKEGEDQILRDEYRLLTRGEKIVEALKTATEDIDSHALEALGRAMKSLHGVSDNDEELSGILDALSDAESILSGAARSMTDYEERLDLSFERLNFVSSRIDEIDLLKRKYSSDGSLDAIFKTLEKNKEELSKYKNHEAYMETLAADLARARERVDSLCNDLSALRKRSAEELSLKLSEALLELNFTEPRVKIEITDLESTSETGRDGVCFNISTNPGERPKPVSEIASGGELSRIMLALKTIFAMSTDVDTLVFDEIDAGISGKTASRVAGRLKALAQGNQVICITHLPQIAAGASHHYLIEKNVKEGQVSSGITHLTEEDHIREVARMLAGDDINEAALTNAKALIAGGS